MQCGNREPAISKERQEAEPKIKENAGLCFVFCVNNGTSIYVVHQEHTT